MTAWKRSFILSFFVTVMLALVLVGGFKVTSAGDAMLGKEHEWSSWVNCEMLCKLGQCLDNALAMLLPAVREFFKALLIGAAKLGQAWQ